MSTLHTVNKSPYERFSLRSCLDHVADGDSVLLIEDAVVGARRGGKFAEMLEAKLPSRAIYVLGPDLAARGMKAEDLAEGVLLVDYGGFVDLAVAHKRVCSWL